MFFYSDHGGMLAGTKRYLNMPGTRVPMIVRFGRDSVYGYTVQANWRAWRDHFETGRTDAIQSRSFQPKPILELSEPGRSGRFPAHHP